MSAYIIFCYFVFLTCTLLGAFSRCFDANLFQRVGLMLFGIWTMWRIYLVYLYGWSYPHEPLIASAFLIYSVSTVYKTFVFWRKSCC